MSLNNYSFVETLNQKQLDQLHDLYQQMWWSIGRTKEEIKGLLENSIYFGLIHNDTKDLVGFTRVLTDKFRYAYIYDVMAVEQLRGKGIGKMMMQHIISNPKFKNVKYFELTCLPEMTEYYKKFGFVEHYGKVVPMRLCTK